MRCNLKRVEVGEFFDFLFVGEEGAFAAEREHKLPRGVALKMSCHALFMARSVNFEGCLAIEPNAAAV